MLLAAAPPHRADSGCPHQPPPIADVAVPPAAPVMVVAAVASSFVFRGSYLVVKPSRCSRTSWCSCDTTYASPKGD